MNNDIRKDGSVVYPQNSNFADVKAFHKKFGVPELSIPDYLDEAAKDFRVKFLEEEKDEYIDACAKGDLPTAFDSLIDLVYVAMGTAAMMGFDEADWQQMWDDVQRANMDKERCTDASKSTRKSTLDVIKPEAWVAPRSEEILNRIIARKQDDGRKV